MLVCTNDFGGVTRFNKMKRDKKLLEVVSRCLDQTLQYYNFFLCA
jgi:hypothetical protein